MKTSRVEVYVAIDGERRYQDERWKDDFVSGGVHQHSVTEWLVYIQDYTLEAMKIVSRESDPQASEKALHIIRKIAAMGVAAMEQLGAPLR